MGGAISGDEGVLDRVSGLLTVSQSPQGHCPEPVAVAPHKLTEGVGVTLDMAGEEILIARPVVSGIVCHRTPSPRLQLVTLMSATRPR